MARISILNVLAIAALQGCGPVGDGHNTVVLASVDDPTSIRLRRDGQFRRVSGTVNCAGGNSVGAPLLMLTDRKACAETIANGGDPALLGWRNIVPSPGQRAAQWQFVGRDVPCGSYSLFCLHHACTPQRLDRVLVQDDFPTDGVNMHLRPTAGLVVIDDVTTGNPEVRGVWAGWWPAGLPDVTRDGRALWLPERDPDGLPCALRWTEPDGATRLCGLRSRDLSDRVQGPFLLSRLLARDISPDRRGILEALHLPPWHEAPRDGAFDFRCQSPRRGAAVHLFLPDGTAATGWSDNYGEVEFNRLRAGVGLVLVDGDGKGDTYVGAAAGGNEPEAVAIPRHPTFLSRGSKEVIVLSSVTRGGRAVTKADVKVSGSSGVRTAVTDERGVCLVRGVTGEVREVTVGFKEGHCLDYSVAAPVRVMTWQLGANEEVRVAFVEVALPEGSIQVQLPPGRREAVRLLLSEVALHEESLKGAWWLDPEQEDTRVAGLTAGPWRLRLQGRDTSSDLFADVSDGGGMEARVLRQHWRPVTELARKDKPGRSSTR